MATPWSVEEFFNDDADVGSNKDERKTTRSTSNSRSHSPLPRAQNSAKPTRASINTGKRAMKRNAQVEFFATCISGMEKILLEEIKALTEVDPSSIRIGKSGVHYSGSMLTGIDSLLWLRTSLRVMERLAETESINGEQSLYDFCYALDWPQVLSTNNTFKCEAVLGRDIPVGLTHSLYTALTLRNAIRDRFRGLQPISSQEEVLPVVDTEDPHMPLLLYLDKGSASLYRVWSGEVSMHKRGYRDAVIHKAALRETTAAFILLLAGWKAMTIPGGANSNSSSIDSYQQYLCDPMCGSGTIAIEAALIAANVAPGLIAYSSTDASYEPYILRWPGVDRESWVRLWNRAKEKDLRGILNQQGVDQAIIANDIHPKSIELAIRSAASAGVQRMIKFSCRDVRYPLWILSGNERLREYFDNELRDKPNYVHNLKAHSGLMQLLKYFIKERRQ
eukprot:gene28386-37320_t